MGNRRQIVTGIKNNYTWHPVIHATCILKFLSFFSPINIGAMAIWPFIVVRKRRRNAADAERLIRHEIIHLKQWQETLIIGFLPFYVLSYLITLARTKNFTAAYRLNWFEREAYAFQFDPNYLDNRPWFNWIRMKGA